MLTCESKNGVCGACYGRDLARGTPVNMGEAVGVIAAQSIGEPGTQLTMRTFHIGGAAQISEQSFIESNFDGKIKFKQQEHRHATRTARLWRWCATWWWRWSIPTAPSARITAFRTARACASTTATRSSAASASPSGIRTPGRSSPKSRHRSTSRIWWTGISMSEALDESTGIAKRVVIDWRTGSSRGQQDLRPASRDQAARTARSSSSRAAATPAICSAVDAIISVDPGAQVKAGDVIARIPTESAKTRDITGGLPRVAELFEARRPKEAAVIAEIGGTVRFGKDYKNKRRITIEPPNKNDEPSEYLIPKGKHIHLQDGDVIEKGDYIVDGNPAPHDILAIKGVEELAAYLVNEIQEVYRLQGVAINDKHIEVIVRQMLQKVEIDDAGETELLQGEQLDKIEIDEINVAHRSRGQEAGDRSSGAARHHQGLAADPLVHLGGVVPGDHARPHRSRGQRQGRYARGLKENVIVGRLIPAGTGAMMNELREVAIKRDALILDEREKEAAKAPPRPKRRKSCRRCLRRSSRLVPQKCKGPPPGGPFCCVRIAKTLDLAERFRP